MKTSPSAPDIVVRGVALDGGVRFFVARTTGIARQLRQTHDAGPIGATAISRLATGTLLLAAGLKHRQQVALQINGDGPIGELYAIADGDGTVRATIGEPQVAAAGLKDAIGAGRLTVTRRLEENAPAYRGIIPLVSGGIAEDMAHYLLTSEQIPSAVRLGETLTPDGIEMAGGFLVQAMPGCDEQALDALVARIGTMPPIAELLNDDQGVDGVLFWLFDDARILATTDLGLKCTCSREHFARKLCTLGEAELERLTEELEETVVECHFCRTTYIFDRDQMNALIYGARMYEQAD